MPGTAGRVLTAVPKRVPFAHPHPSTRVRRDEGASRLGTARVSQAGGRLFHHRVEGRTSCRKKRFGQEQIAGADADAGTRPSGGLPLPQVLSMPRASIPAPSSVAPRCPNNLPYARSRPWKMTLAYLCCALTWRTGVVSPLKRP